MIIITPDIEPRLNWLELCDAFEAGHKLPPAEIADSFLYRGDDTLLNRCAWIDGLGQLVKCATIFPHNPKHHLPSVNGAVALFSDKTGMLEAMVDFHLVTKWKTAGDSLLAARKLARPGSRLILLVGAGAVARSMVPAYRAIFPQAQFMIWNRTFEKAQELARDLGIEATQNLEQAVRKADIICTCTMSQSPLIMGDWLRPGQHLDLIGAYRPDMREVDDNALRRASLFVDNRRTTLNHIGELQDPIKRGIITEHDILADFYDLTAQSYKRRHEDEITIAKNGGGAHLDLMTAVYIFAAWQNAQPV